MALFEPQTIFEVPLEGDGRRQAAGLIRWVRQVSARGKGTLPLPRVLDMVGFEKTVAARIRKRRGDVILKCPQGPKGILRGTFLNTGQTLRESIPNVPAFMPDIVAAKRVAGYYEVKPNRLEMTRVQGLTVVKNVGDNLFDLTYRVELIVLTPNYIALY